MDTLPALRTVKFENYVENQGRDQQNKLYFPSINTYEPVSKHQTLEQSIGA
jgi:hypothetical protein